MSSFRRTPADVAKALSSRGRRAGDVGTTSWRRETYTLPRNEARVTAREWFAQFPKSAYMTEVESWRELEDGRIEFTMRRLPSAD